MGFRDQDAACEVKTFAQSGAIIGVDGGRTQLV